MKLSIKVSVLSIAFVSSPCLTTAVHATVKKKVLMSIISRVLILLTLNNKPAISGEIRYLALPARLTIPLALEYSSEVNKSVTVALYEGSRREEKAELIKKTNEK